jgi:hypothetical protein
MAEFTPVDHDPFASARYKLTPVEFDPFGKPSVDGADDKPETFGEAYQGLSRSAVSGATLGFGDELEAALRKYTKPGGSLSAGPMGPLVEALMLASRRKGDTDKTYEKLLEEVRGQQRKFQERHPGGALATEIAGGFLVPAAGIGRIAQGAKTLERVKQSAKLGATYGGVAGYGYGEGGTYNRLKSALQSGATGAVLSPVLTEAVVPGVVQLGKGIKDAARYGERAVESVRDPKQTAIKTVADTLVESGVEPQDLRALVLQGKDGAPLLSAALRKRGFSDENLADLIASRMEGVDPATIAAAHTAEGRNITARTVNDYFKRYQANNPTPMNIGDMAQELAGPGRAQPVLRLGRRSYSLADEGGVAQSADELLSRQMEQPGRIGQIVKRSGGDQDFEARLTGLRTTAKADEQAAYRTAYADEQPFDLRPVIKEARARVSRRGGEISQKMSDAIDLLFEPSLAQRPQSPSGALRLKEAAERVTEAQQKGAAPEVVSRLQRRLAVMRDQDQFSRPLARRKIGQPITTLRSYVDARRDLSQMISRSYQDGRPTPLTAELTQLRQALNEQVKSTNPAFAAADAQFSGNRAAEALLERGAKTGKTLTPKTRAEIRDFRTMTPAQQEIYRVAFEQSLADAALNTKDWAAAANQFQTPAFRKVVEAFYPKTAGKDIYQRGKYILRNLRREAFTTATKNMYTAGSRTAELASDMERGVETAKTAANVLTGRFWSVLENLQSRLTTQLGADGATEVMRVLSETQPRELLRTLNKLARAAQSTKQRQAYVMVIREVRRNRINQLPAPIGVLVGRSNVTDLETQP